MTARAKWAERLGVPADAPPDAAAAAFLRALPADLLPPEEHVAAASALTGAALPTGRAGAVPVRLREELTAFAQRFWSLAPGDRLLAWDDLARRGADPARLRELEPGLDVAVTPIDDPVAAELADQFRALFVLPPRERAIRRAAWLLGRAEHAGRWRSALAVVQRDAPALVALEPGLRGAFDRSFDLAALELGARESPVAADVADFTHRVRASEAHGPRPDRPPPRPSKSGTSSGPVIGSGVLVVLFLLFRLVVALGRSDAPKPNYAPVKSPDHSYYTLPQNGTKGPVFTEQEVNEFKWYERSLAAGRDPIRPGKYDMWVLVNRPLAHPPEPDKVSVYFTEFEISACQWYARKGGKRPPDYDAWLMAGKPSTPGTYNVSKPPTQP